MLSEKPIKRQNINENYIRQQNIDVIDLYAHNKKLANKPPA